MSVINFRLYVGAPLSSNTGASEGTVFGCAVTPTATERKCKAVEQLNSKGMFFS